MSEFLPRLRTALDFLPSPVPDRPGLVLRDPLRYCEDVLIIPPEWVPVLGCLDGKHTEVDVQALLMRQRGRELVLGHVVREFVSELRNRGFLETEEFSALRKTRHAEFRAAGERRSVHAGGAYPEDPLLLKDTFDTYFSRTESSIASGGLVGIAAPHVSPDGGEDCYAAAYDRLDSSLAEKTFVILGTSHYGRPNTFGLTRKSFTTPLGKVEVDEESVEFLSAQAPEVVEMEDYCHAIEHSIEFQVVFLQHRLGTAVRIIPILCGPLMESLENGGAPESSGSGTFVDALAELARGKKEDLFWILGIDLSHMGKRYGDPFSASAYEGQMASVETEDRLRLDRVCEADFAGLKELVQPETDRLKWCGFSPLYTFLASMGHVQDIRGRLLKYQQWSIDPESVVSFAGIEFISSRQTS